MNKRFCTNNLRNYLRPLPTREEIERLKKMISYQKNLRKRLINSQYWLTMNYNHIDFQRELNSSDSDRTKQISQIFGNSIEESVINKIEVPIIKILNCLIIIANGYGIARKNSSLLDVNIEEINDRFDEDDISLSKACGKLLNRSV